MSRGYPEGMTTPDAAPGCPLLVGCGYVGTRLARHLGPSTCALVRSQVSALALTAQGVLARAVDLDQAQPELGPMVPPEAVVYLAPPPDAGTEDLRLARFLAALGVAPPRVVVYLSTTGVYGDVQGAAVDEATPPRPREDRSRRRLDAETRASDWCAARGARCVVLRVPAIYGPHRLPLERIQRGEPVLCAAESGPGNRIHVDDLVAACRAALARPVAGVVNVADGHGESTGAFTRRVASLAGLPLPPEVSWAEAQARISPGLLAFLRESRRVVNHRLVAELGVAPRPPERGIKESLAEVGWVPPRA